MQVSDGQKTITTRSAAHNKQNIYAVLNIDAIYDAMALLSANTFKLWVYMAKNQNNYTFALSCVDACRVCKMSKPTYLKCVNELIECGYLVQTESNKYDFFEKLPKVGDIEITINKAEPIVEEEFTF